MATDLDEPLSDRQKAEIVEGFILDAPPGEFREVLNDVRILLDDDNILTEKGTGVFATYCQEQLTPVRLKGADDATLITKFNVDKTGRYFDPRSRKSFKYDFIKEEAGDILDWTPDEVAEPWRAALQDAWALYAKNHYTNATSAVFASTSDGQITLTACIEGHQLQPKNFCNGRWRSIWTLTFSPSDGKSDLRGEIHVNVHYYEDGNVQLVSHKEIKEPVVIENETSLAKEFVSLVESAESDYQVALSENYTTMSDTTFKALRRPLPVTRTKIDWNKIMSYKIGSELKQQ